MIEPLNVLLGEIVIYVSLELSVVSNICVLVCIPTCQAEEAF